MSKGLFISVVGPPGVGKSFLVNKLADFYNGKAIDGNKYKLPKQIIEYKKDFSNNLAIILWFRNKGISNLLLAKKIKENNKIIISQNFWYSNLAFANLRLTGFEKKLFLKTFEIDKKLLDYPDIIIYLNSDMSKTKQLIKNRKKRLKDNKNLINWYESISKEMKNIFIKKRFGDKLIIFDRSQIDFNNLDDFHKLTKVIDAKIKKM